MPYLSVQAEWDIVGAQERTRRRRNETGGIMVILQRLGKVLDILDQVSIYSVDRSIFQGRIEPDDEYAEEKERYVEDSQPELRLAYVLLQQSHVRDRLGSFSNNRLAQFYWKRSTERSHLFI
jgi:hypothetical protein